MKNFVEIYETLSEREKVIDQDDLFIYLISKGYENLTDDEKVIFNEMTELCSFMYRVNHKISTVSFRQKLYFLEDLGDSKYQYLGGVDSIMDMYLVTQKLGY